MEEVLALGLHLCSCAPTAPRSPPSLQHSAPAIILNGRFRLRTLIATGGTSYVHRAHDQRAARYFPAGTDLAVKVPRPLPQLRRLGSDFRARQIIYEVLITQRLTHANIIRMFDLHSEGEIHYLSMEYIDGESLAAMLRRAPGRCLSPATVATILQRIGAGVTATHREGIVHSDLKPSNILISNRGELKLIDFANARRLHSQTALAEMPLTAPHVGFSTAYSSLETMEDRPPSTSDDIYSLGCIVYEMLTGTHPYQRCSPREALTRNLVPARPGHIRGKAWRALRKALQLRAADRMQEVAELLHPFR